ncbi:hypothetical protein ACWGJT_30120 [Streptomyces xantholiticus]
MKTHAAFEKESSSPFLMHLPNLTVWTTDSGRSNDSLPYRPMPSVAACSHFSPSRKYFQKTGLFSAWPDFGAAGPGAQLLDALALLAAGGDEAGPVGMAGDAGGEPGAFGGAGLGLGAAVGAEPPVGEVAPLVDGAEGGPPSRPAAGVLAVRHHDGGERHLSRMYGQ